MYRLAMPFFAYPGPGADRRGRRALGECTYRLAMPFFAYPGLEQIGAAGADDLQAPRRMICTPGAGHSSDAINDIAGGGAARRPRTKPAAFRATPPRGPPAVREERRRGRQVEADQRTVAARQLDRPPASVAEGRPDERIGRQVEQVDGEPVGPQVRRSELVRRPAIRHERALAAEHDDDADPAAGLAGDAAGSDGDAVLSQ